MQYSVTPQYVFQEAAFIENYKYFESCFQRLYPNYRVSYSFKTNYTPYICNLVKNLGGYAEVVSMMEYTLAKKLGYSDDKIIFNGPSKEEFPNCILNVDNLDELAKAIGMFSPDDANRIMRAIHQDTKAKQVQAEIEDEENRIGEEIEQNANRIEKE